jgi:hypothetical protein
MAVRNFWQEPPYGAELVDGKSRVTAPWHIWLNFVAKFLGRRIIVDVVSDPPSLVAGAAASASVTVPNAEAGDFAVASFTPMDAGISITAQVTAANTVTVWLHNLSGGTIDLASGTLRVMVEKNT